tara:strand:+ start:35635 stop:36840 length:1206 start_codon:yes stop_codon:yes gene_type:complete
MIKVDINKFSLKKVFLKKINSNGYINFYNNIEEIRQNKYHSLKGNKNLYQKVKSTSNVKLSDFSFSPKPAYILLYENYPINVEYCAVSEYYQDKNSNFIKRREEDLKNLIEMWHKNKLVSYENLIKRLEKNKDNIYFDGKYIIFSKKEKTDENNAKNDQEENKDKKVKRNLEYKKKSIDDSKNFFLTNVKGISLADFNFKTVKRKTLSYELELDNEKYISYFPSFSSLKIDKFDEFASQYFINYNFPIDCAKYLSEYFDEETLDFLEIEKVLIEMGTLNIFNIEEDIRSVNKYTDEVINCFVWLAGLIYKSYSIEQIIGLKTIFSNLTSKKGRGYLTRISLLKERNELIGDSTPKKLKNINSVIQEKKKNIKNKRIKDQEKTRLNFLIEELEEEKESVYLD